MRFSLVIDADDTLWENNIYFEAAFEEFVAFLGHSRLGPREIRAVLDEIESANSRIHGYGSRNFGRNLRQCYRALAERQIGDADLDTVMGFAERILEQPMEVIEGVAETLEYLAPRHDLTLFTKGHPEEQRVKIERSGLGAFFAHAAIVKEKDAAAYRALARERGFDPELSWMIGNSPKSDINPALEAGWNAVFVPHARTWTLEREKIEPREGRLLAVARFADLQRHF
jgi:putative hydrolase of the HAD superfamily